MSSSPIFRILFVCTGNVCRSPMAERIARHAVAAHRRGDAAGGIEVQSAGTLGWSGAPMEPFAVRALASRGISADGFAAHELRRSDVRLADLVLGAAREHRAATVKLLPEAAPRTYTLRQFARLVGPVSGDELPASTPERGRALVQQAARQRGLVPPDRPDDDDIRDPFGQAEQVFAQCLLEIEASLLGPLALLLGAGPVGV